MDNNNAEKRLFQVSSVSKSKANGEQSERFVFQFAGSCSIFCENQL